jgi:SHS family lactate transporter-like MFS transporter
MAIAAESAQVAWWKEPTREQWHAWIAAWLGWTLDAFDFTIFLLLMLPISQSFHVPLVDVTAVLALTLWMRLVGATMSGWLADRIGRKTPLMISIAWYSIANLLAGLSQKHTMRSLRRSLSHETTRAGRRLAPERSVNGKRVRTMLPNANT